MNTAKSDRLDGADKSDSGKALSTQASDWRGMIRWFSSTVSAQIASRSAVRPLRGEAQRFACRRWAKSFVSSSESPRENDRVGQGKSKFPARCWVAGSGGPALGEAVFKFRQNLKLEAQSTALPAAIVSSCPARAVPARRATHGANNFPSESTPKEPACR